MCDRNGDLIINQVVRFFEHFVAGRANGFEMTPHVQIFHEAQNAADVAPRWVTTHHAWPPPALRVGSLALTQEGGLAGNLPGQDGALRYRYPTASAGTESGILFGQRGLLWAAPFDTSGAAVFTTPPLSSPIEALGPASVDLWFESTAMDTDLQATVTEVRPDGQEVYVVRGWLRASHRTLDEESSTPLLPIHTHAASDARPLQPGVPTRLRLAILPFNHLFRTGSRLRLILDTPSQTGGWGFEITPQPATNTVLTGESYPSWLRLGLLPRPSGMPELPACGSLLNQPCRADPFSAMTPTSPPIDIPYVP